MAPSKSIEVMRYTETVYWDDTGNEVMRVRNYDDSWYDTEASGLEVSETELADYYDDPDEDEEGLSMSIEMGTKVRAKWNPYGFKPGMLGTVVEVFPKDHCGDGGKTRMYGVSFAESGEPDSVTTTGWNMLSTEIEEV